MQSYSTPVHIFHLVDDPVRSAAKDLPRDLRRLRGHKVDRVNRPESHRIVIGPLIAHNAYRAHIGKRREILSDAAVQTGIGDLLPVNGVRVLDDPNLFRSYLANDPDTKAPGPGNG